MSKQENKGSQDTENTKAQRAAQLKFDTQPMILESCFTSTWENIGDINMRRGRIYGANQSKKRKYDQEWHCTDLRFPTNTSMN